CQRLVAFGVIEIRLHLQLGVVIERAVDPCEEVGAADRDIAGRCLSQAAVVSVPLQCELGAAVAPVGAESGLFAVPTVDLVDALRRAGVVVLRKASIDAVVRTAGGRAAVPYRQ